MLRQTNNRSRTDFKAPPICGAFFFRLIIGLVVAWQLSQFRKLQHAFTPLSEIRFDAIDNQALKLVFVIPKVGTSLVHLPRFLVFWG